MERAQTSIEYLLVLGAALVVVGALTALLLSSISAPQPQVHCSYNAFLNQVPLGPLDVNVNLPTSCKPSQASVNNAGTMPNTIEVWVGGAGCDSSGNLQTYVDGIALFVTDPNNNIVCTNSEGTSNVGSQYSDSLSLDYSKYYHQPTPGCYQAQSTDFGRNNYVKGPGSPCVLSSPGPYDIHAWGHSNGGTGTIDHHTAVQVGAIVAS